MNYITTELLDTDLDNLTKIFHELEKINIPTVFTNTICRKYHATRTGTFTQKDARQCSFGVTTYRGKRIESKMSKKYPHIIPLFKDFIDKHKDGFKFESVYVNKNTICKKHLDSKNVGESLLVGFGDYTGGETVLYGNNEEKHFNISTCSLIFNGAKIEHSSEKFNGTRYSLVFF
jgi:hypothetical protein